VSSVLDALLPGDIAGLPCGRSAAAAISSPDGAPLGAFDRPGGAFGRGTNRAFGRATLCRLAAASAAVDRAMVENMESRSPPRLALRVIYTPSSPQRRSKRPSCLHAAT
jgi:hypothetical protein